MDALTREDALAEQAELGARFKKWAAFRASPAFELMPDAEKNRLESQAVLMLQYSDILSERIRAFLGAKHLR
jgi:hypothetical protein